MFSGSTRSHEGWSVRPNNSFKPTLLRYGNGVAEEACHAVASTAQVGLARALGCMGTLLAIVQLGLVPILLVVALAVRSAGNSKPLNVVDYARVTDPVALHHWAGNRLLLLPLVFCLTGLLSFRNPGLALLLFGAATIMSLCLAVWLALGAEKFQSAA